MILDFLHNRLGSRLVLYSLLIGSILSVFSTGIQLLVSYDRQKADATAILDQIDETLSETLQLALWTFDFDQINTLLDGLATNDSVAHVELTSETGQSWERGTRIENTVAEQFDLVRRTPDGSIQLLGRLRVQISLEIVNARIWEQFWVAFLTNLAKAYVAAVALLFVVYWMITRHLRKIAKHVDGTDVNAGPTDLRLDRRPGKRPDDLDRIVIAMHDFEQRASQTLAQLQQEVSERIRSEREARAALSVRSSFIGTMSHEVRTPLNAIMGFLHLIESDTDVPDKQRTYAHVATKAAQQLHNQLTNVLEMSRLDSRAVTISQRPTDIRHLARQWQATAAASVHYHQKSIEVTLDLDEGLDQAYMLDGARLTQIVTNLTDNAAKFTERGEIRIGVRREPLVHDGHDTHGLEISVADTGVGIDAAQRQLVFERFTQADASIGRTYGGSGLGLTISREISALMGATLTLADAKKDGFSTRLLITQGCMVRLEHCDG